LLARVATHCLELGCERPLIVSVQPEVNRLLRSMGFDQVFILVEDPTAPTAGLANAAQLAGISTRPDPDSSSMPTGPCARSTKRTATCSRT
jgi:hypothetical protein